MLFVMSRGILNYMRFFLVFLILTGLTYGGYLLYRQSTYSSSPPLFRAPSSDGITLSAPDQLWQNLESVLGESINRGITGVTNLANQVSGGTAEPIINQAISDLQQKIKDLPQDQAQKLQYNYCKTVVTEYENDNQ